MNALVKGACDIFHKTTTYYSIKLKMGEISHVYLEVIKVSSLNLIQ